VVTQQNKKFSIEQNSERDKIPIFKAKNPRGGGGAQVPHVASPPPEDTLLSGPARYAKCLFKINLRILLRKTGVRLNLKITLTSLPIYPEI
jgi:hypothetical protein